MRNSLGFFLLPLLLLIFFHDVAFLGKTFSTSSLIPGITPDGPDGFSGHRPAVPFSFDVSGNAWVNEPNPYVIKEAISQGAMPLWNPGEGIGMPLIGNLNTEVLNPAKAILNLYPSPLLQDFFFLFRLSFMGLFTYLFLREMKLSSIPSLLGGSFFMLSGYAVWWINLHPLSTVMYLPAVFYFYERWNVRNDRKSPFFMTLVFCCSILGGKLSEIITGVSLLFLYGVSHGISSGGFKGLAREAMKLALIVITGLLLSAPAFLPFYELHGVASPIAKAIRTGASSHTLPLLSSISMWQPLFLGKNYFYSSWFNYEPRAMLMYAGMTVLVLFFYSQLNLHNNRKIWAFVFFALLLFFQVYGLVPYRLVTHTPIFREVNYLKYNGMIYFSLSVISAYALEDLMNSTRRRTVFLLASGIVVSLLLIYYHMLSGRAPDEMIPYLRKVLIATLLGLGCIVAAYLLLKNRKIFGMTVFACMLCEFYVYMPKDHPIRYFPYHLPAGHASVRQDYPYRIGGDGRSIPPLVSSAAGFLDVRGIDVLIPRDYYVFFENLISFSVPYTNSPDALVAGTSPFSDLLGVKHILSSRPLSYDLLEERVRTHVRSLRWIRLFDAMKKHNMEGGASLGFFKSAGEERFSFFFPLRFRFMTTERVTEPFLFAGFALKDASTNASCNITIKIGDQERNVVVRGGEEWRDQWVDVSEYLGRIVDIAIEGSGSGHGRVVLGEFGFSPGKKKEEMLCQELAALHKKEIMNFEYKGVTEGLYHYENTNVMNRAFIVHKIKSVNSLDDVMRELQGGSDFREVGLVMGDITMPASQMRGPQEVPSSLQYERKVEGDTVVIRKYTSDEVVIHVESDGGLLVLSDLYYPGWKAKVNRREAEIVKAFGILRGVVVGKGRSEVVFYYRPLSLYLGILVSMLTVAAWILYSYFRRRS